MYTTVALHGSCTTLAVWYTGLCNSLLFFSVLSSEMVWSLGLGSTFSDLSTRLCLGRDELCKESVGCSVNCTVQKTASQTIRCWPQLIGLCMSAVSVVLHSYKQHHLNQIHSSVPSSVSKCFALFWLIFLGDLSFWLHYTNPPPYGYLRLSLWCPSTNLAAVPCLCSPSTVDVLICIVTSL